MRKLVLVLLLSVVSTGVLALGLGNIELNSGLNQPFNARIELLSPTSSEMESLTVGLAGLEAFNRAGIERSFLLSSLQFEIEQSETGPDYIRITSREAIREPFLNFLLEAGWSNGRLFREYTVLLDPPLYDPSAGRSTISTSPASSLPTQIFTPVDQDSSPAATGTVSVPSQYVPSFSGNEYGPISGNETLWSIANQIRPDSSVSVQQMMLALLRANPEAFIQNNINGLRQGQILRIPGQDEITGTSPDQAFAEVSSQNAMWEEIRGTLASTVSERPFSTSAQPEVAGTATGVDDGSQLRLVAAGDQNMDSGQSSTSGTGSDANLALMDEQLTTLTSENTDLRDRLAESEALIDDLKRLIELKDDELASLQQQMAGAVSGEVVPPVEETTVEEETTTQTFPAEEGESTTTEGTGSTDAEQVVEEEVIVEEPVTEVVPAPETTEVIQVAPAQQGMVDQIISFVTDNLIMVGGGLAGLLVVIGLLAFVRKRKATSENEEAAALTEFPDFDSAADETGAVAEDDSGPEIDIDIESGTDADKTAFIGEVESAELAKGASQPAGAEAVAVQSTGAGQAVEDPLDEVNVFLAYEHFDQAEEFVRDAILKQPSNLDFHSKLLEVFYSSGDKVMYEEEAKVLYDLANGEGPHWEMASIMWQEMSPNRALFAEPAEGEDDSRQDNTSSRGIVDLTADEDAGDDSALDFDLGMGTEESAPKQAASDSDDVLDITSGSEDVLDVTAAEPAGDEDLLDVTAAVGLDSYQESSGGDDNSINMGPADDQDILDISATGGEDPLDVTAHSDLEVESGEDLLDVTSAVSMGEDSGSLDIPAPGADNPATGDDNSLDFDVGGLSLDVPVSSELSIDSAGSDENVIDFDAVAGGTDGDGGIELDLGSDEPAEAGDGGIELDLGSDEAAEAGDGGIELDLGSDEAAEEGDGGMELTLDTDSNEDDGGIGLTLEGDEPAGQGSDNEIKFDLSIEDEASPPIPEIDMESTLKIPKNSGLSLENADDDDDDDDDHTVFVPRSSATKEQSAEDEVATKLDLAKAYVELGDKDSAKTILEEIIADGNASQKKQAQDLMKQVS